MGNFIFLFSFLFMSLSFSESESVFENDIEVKIRGYFPVSHRYQDTSTHLKCRRDGSVKLFLTFRFIDSDGEDDYYSFPKMISKLGCNRRGFFLRETQSEDFTIEVLVTEIVEDKRYEINALLNY